MTTACSATARRTGTTPETGIARALAASAEGVAFGGGVVAVGGDGEVAPGGIGLGAGPGGGGRVRVGLANPVPALAAMFTADPALALACVDLVPRLRRTAEIMLAGLIPSR